MILCVCPNPSIDTYAWLDKIVFGSSNRISKIMEFSGGKGVHIAQALAELKVQTEIMGVWGGYSGQRLIASLEKSNIKISGIHVEDENRKCYTFISNDSHFSQTELLEPGPYLTPQKWTEFKKAFRNSVRLASIVCMAGSWPKNVPTDAYAQLISIAKEFDVWVLLDCTGTQLKNALEIGFFGLHLNESEALEVGGTNSLRELQQKIGAKVQFIALTKGKEGLELFYNNSFLKANVDLEEEIFSAVGSGDCLTAGLAYGLEKELEIEKIASLGVACGAANCLTEDLGMLKEEDVNVLLPRVKVHSLL